MIKIIELELRNRGLYGEVSEAQTIANRLAPLIMRILAFDELHLVPRCFDSSVLGPKAYCIQDFSPYDFSKKDEYYGVESTTMACFEKIVLQYVGNKTSFRYESRVINVGGWGGDRQFPICRITHHTTPSMYLQFVSAFMAQIVTKGMEERILDSNTCVVYLNAGFQCVQERNAAIGLFMIDNCNKRIHAGTFSSEKKSEEKKEALVPSD